MLFAYTDEKKMIEAAMVKENQICFCPDCGERLIRKVGKIKIPHFSHFNRSHCVGLSEGETPEHLELKALFLKWGARFEVNWKLEQPLADLPQRPDLLNEQLAVEIQCSSIQGSRLKERIVGYQEKNYQDWWLLGQRLWPKETFTSLQKQFCSFDKEKGLHLWLIEKKQIRLLYHIHDNKGLVYRERQWPAFSLPLKQIFHSTNYQKPLKIVPSRENILLNKQMLNVKLVQSNPRILKLQQFFYQERRHLLYLTEWIYFPSRYFFFYQEDVFLFRYLFQREAKHASRIFTKFMDYRAANQREWLFHRVNQQEILERLYLEAIFLSKKG